MNTIVEHINSTGFSFTEFAVPMLVQSGILIVILLLLDLLLRKKVKAVFRYWIWMLVLVKLVLPTSLSSPLSLGYFFGEKLTYQDLAQSSPTLEPTVPTPADISSSVGSIYIQPNPYIPTSRPVTSIVEPMITEPTGPPPTPVTPLSWQGVVFLVWLAVVIAMGLLLLQRALFVRGLVAQAKKASRLMNDELAYCCASMKIKCKVGLKVSVNATTPSVCGLIRPVVLVPWNLTSTLGVSRMRTVLMHELAHIKRADLWVNLAQTALQIIYFYNPLLWLANCMIRRIREQSVDEAVLVAMGEKARRYPQTLVDVAKLAFKRPALSLRLIGVVESKSALAGRIKHILGRPIPKSARLGLISILAIIIAGAVLLPMARAQRQAEPETNVEDSSLDHFVGKYAMAGHPDKAAFEITKKGDVFIFRDLGGPKFEMDLVLRGLGGRSFEMEKGRDNLKFGDNRRDRFRVRYDASENRYILDSLGMRGEVQDSMISPLTDLVKISAENSEDAFTVTLPHGGKLRLLALGRPTDTTGRCWEPDGTAIVGKPDWFADWERFRRNWSSSYLIAIVEAVHPGTSPPSAAIGPSGEEWKIPLIVAKGVDKPRDGVKPSLVLGFGVGEWKTVGWLKVGESLKVGDFECEIEKVEAMIRKVPRVPNSSGTTLVQAWFTELPDLEVALVAVGKSGKETTVGVTWGVREDIPVAGNKWQLKQPTLFDIDDLDHFVVRKRPRYWSTFTEFAIEPKRELTKDSRFSATLANGVTVDLLGICEHPSVGKQWWRPDGSLLEEAPYDDDFGRAFPQDGEKGYKFAVKYSGLAGKEVDARVIPTNFKTTNGGALFSTSEKNGKENTKYVEGLLDEKIVWLGAAFDEKMDHCDIRIGVCLGDWKSGYRYKTDQPNDVVEWVGFKNVSLRPSVKTDVRVEVEETISLKLVMLLDAINSCAAEVDLNIDSVSITDRNISIKGDTSGRINTRKFLDVVKDNGLNVSSLRLNVADNRDKFSIIVEPKQDWQQWWRQRKTDVQLGAEETVTPKLVLLLAAIKSVAAEMDLNIESISVSTKSMSIKGDTSRRTETLKFLDAIKENGLEVSQLNLDSRNGRDRFRMTVEPKENWQQLWQQHKTAVPVEGEGSETDGLVWGKKVNGLRAAVEFVPEKEAYSYGQIIGLRYHIQSVSAEPIQFTSHTWRQDLNATVEDEEGNLQPVDYNGYSGWTPVERYYLKPGEKVVLERSAFGIVADNKQAEALGHPVGCTLVCKPGIYSVSFSIRIPAVRSSSLPPEAEDWEGVLQTGKRKLVVTAASGPEKKNDMPVDSEPVDTDNPRDAVSAIVEQLKSVKYVNSGRGSADLVEIHTNSSYQSSTRTERILDFRFEGDLSRSDAFTYEKGKRGDFERSWAVGPVSSVSYNKVYGSATVQSRPFGQFYRKLGYDFHPETFPRMDQISIVELLEAVVKQPKVTLKVTREPKNTVRIVSEHKKEKSEEKLIMLLINGSDGMRLSSWEYTARDSTEDGTGARRSSLRLKWKKYAGLWYISEAISEGAGVHDGLRSEGRTTVTIREFTPNVDIEDKEFTLDGLDIPPGAMVNDWILDTRYRYAGSKGESADMLRKLSRAAQMYANDYDNKFPDSMQQLKQFLDEKELKWLSENVCYLGKGKTVLDLPDIPLAYDRTMLEAKQSIGTNVLFVSGIVSFRTREQIKKLGITAGPKTDVPVEGEQGGESPESKTTEPKAQEPVKQRGGISGVVVNSVTGQPIAGAYVGVGDFGDSGGSNYSRHVSEGFHDKTKTDAEGRFELGGLVFTDKHRELEYHPLVVAHPDFIRHDEKIELLSTGPAPNVKVSFRPAAKIEVTIVDADGNPIQGQWLLRLEALDGRRFIPPGSDPHLSSFASNIWAHWPDLRSNMGISNGFTFTELDSGRYLIEAIRVSLVDKPTPQNIWKSAITYHGSIPSLEIEAGQVKQVKLGPRDNQTKLTITPPEFPDKLMGRLERSSQMPLMCLISRSPGALLWDDGKIRHLEDQRLGRIDKERFFRAFFVQGKPLTINNLPPGSYSLFTMAVYGHVTGYLIGARADLEKGDKITVDISWRKPTGPSMFGPNRSFDYPVKLETRDYSVSQLCGMLTEITRSNPRIIADFSIENEKLSFDKGEMSVWDVLEKLYLDNGWRVDEGQDKTLIIKPAEQTDTPVEGEGTTGAESRRAISEGRKERIELFGLDLTDAPRTTKSADLSDLFEERPPGSKSYHIRRGVIAVYDRIDGTVYYIPDKEIFYIQHDKLGSSTLTYYGPFNGDPHKFLGPKKDVLVDVKEAEASSGKSEVTASEDGPRITFENPVYDFGQVPPKTKHVCEFKFTNTGKEVLKITKVRSTCGCIISKLKKKEYAPGESETLEATYQSSASAERVKKYVFVYSNDEANPKVILTVKAEIVIKVAHEPKRFNLVLDKENAGCPAITLTSIDNHPFSITGFKSTGDSITAEFDSSVKETSFAIQPKVDMEKLRKGLKGQIEISLTHPECKTLMIVYNTLPEFEFDPRVVYVREAEPLKSVTKTVRIRSNYNEDVEIQSTSIKKGTVKVLTQKKIRNGYQFELQITPPLQESNKRVFTDVFTVVLKGGQQLQITFYGIYSKKPAKTTVVSIPQTNAPVEESFGEQRIVHFPNRSLGKLCVLRETVGAPEHWWWGFHSQWQHLRSPWQYLAEARGDVSVPAGKRLGLIVGRELMGTS